MFNEGRPVKQYGEAQAIVTGNTNNNFDSTLRLWQSPCCIANMGRGALSS